MNIRSGRRKTRRAVSGIIAGLILFVMLFSVGTGYFLWVDTNNSLYSQAQAYRAQADQLAQNEKVLVTTSCCNSGNLSFITQNQGSLPVTFIAVYVDDASGNVFAKKFTLTLNPGTTSMVLTTNCNPAGTCNIASATVNVLTQRGNVFGGPYPLPSLNSAVNALIAGSIGDIQIKFDTFAYFNVTHSASCPSVSDSSGYCFAKVPGRSAFNIPASVACGSCALAFEIQVTNLSPSKSSITLDSFTYIEQFWGKGSSFRVQPFFIISNTSRTILNHYTPITLVFNKTTTLIFSADAGSNGCVLISSTNPPASEGCGTYTPAFFTGSTAITPGSVAFISIFAHGWKAVSTPPYDITKTNYGQNIPFVTTLYS
jgi:hypothetical protein